MNTMTISNSEMEAPAARKWLEACNGGWEKVRRERKVRMKKKGAVRIIMSEINITDDKSVGNILMKRIVSLKYFTYRKSIGKKEAVGNSIFQIPTYYPLVKKKKKNIKLFYINYRRSSRRLWFPAIRRQHLSTVWPIYM